MTQLCLQAPATGRERSAWGSPGAAGGEEEVGFRTNLRSNRPGSSSHDAGLQDVHGHGHHASHGARSTPDGYVLPVGKLARPVAPSTPCGSHTVDDIVIHVHQPDNCLLPPDRLEDFQCCEHCSFVRVARGGAGR